MVKVNMPKPVEMPEEKVPDPRNPFSRAEIRRGKEHGGARENHEHTGGQIAAALHIQHRDNIGDRVREMVHAERTRLAAIEAGYETFEEADDFDVDDDTFDPKTPYEEVFAGSIQEDVNERYAAQQEQLKKVPAENLVEFMKAMDPKELAKALELVQAKKKDGDPADPVT